MSYSAARQQQNNTATHAQRSAMQPFAMSAAARMPNIANNTKTDQLPGLFLLIVVIVINTLLLSSGSGGGLG